MTLTRASCMHVRRLINLTSTSTNLNFNFNCLFYSTTLRHSFNAVQNGSLQSRVQMIQANSRPLAVHVWTLADSYSKEPLNISLDAEDGISLIRISMQTSSLLFPAGRTANRLLLDPQDVEEALPTDGTSTTTSSRTYHRRRCILIPDQRRHSTSCLARHLRLIQVEATSRLQRPYLRTSVSLVTRPWCEFLYAVPSTTLARRCREGRAHTMKIRTRPVLLKYRPLHKDHHYP